MSLTIELSWPLLNPLAAQFYTTWGMLNEDNSNSRVNLELQIVAIFVVLRGWETNGLQHANIILS